jgi:hypothetical protein
MIIEELIIRLRMRGLHENLTTLKSKHTEPSTVDASQVDRNVVDSLLLS